MESLAFPTTQVEIVELILRMFQPDFVFSLTFFIGFIGFGAFFSRQVWPWLKDYLDRRMEYEMQISKQRWEVMTHLSEDLSEIKATLPLIHEAQRLLIDRLLRGRGEDKDE